MTSTPLQQLEQWLSGQIIGQHDLIHKLLIALLADGHLLVEGAPGLAKTRAIKQMSEGIEGGFHRIQFTPDLLPGDITGTDIFRPQQGTFEFQQGPIFNNLILADEINRAPAKVQSALLEAMAERQVSVGTRTYPLPEAQLDRFLMQVNVSYPDAEAETRILKLARREASGTTPAPPQPLTQEAVFKARQAVLSVHMAEAVEAYIVQLVIATREPGAYDNELSDWLEFGASPRATIALDRCARANAYLHGRDYVSPDDVQAVVTDCLKHRLILSFEAEAAGVTRAQVINRLLETVAVG